MNTRRDDMLQETKTCRVRSMIGKSATLSKASDTGSSSLIILCMAQPSAISFVYRGDQVQLNASGRVLAATHAHGWLNGLTRGENIPARSSFTMCMEIPRHSVPCTVVPRMAPFQQVVHANSSQIVRDIPLAMLTDSIRVVVSVLLRHSMPHLVFLLCFRFVQFPLMDDPNLKAGLRLIDL